MATLVTGAGLIGTAFAKNALARGEAIVFVDPEPRMDFLRMKLGGEGYTLARQDVRDLAALIETIRAHRIDTVVHTAGLIGGRVQQSLSLAFDINLGGTRNVAEAVRLCGVRRLVHLSSLAVYDRRREGNGPLTENFSRGQGRGYGKLQGGQGADPRGLCRCLLLRADHAAACQCLWARPLLVGLEQRPEDAEPDRSRFRGARRAHPVV